MQHDCNNNQYILCVGLCVLDVIHACQEYPEEDSDRRYFIVLNRFCVF